MTAERLSRGSPVQLARPRRRAGGAAQGRPDARGQRGRAEPRVRAGDQGGRGSCWRCPGRASCATTAPVPPRSWAAGATTASCGCRSPSTINLDGDTVVARVLRSGSPQRAEVRNRRRDPRRDAAQRRLPRRRGRPGKGRRPALGRAGRGNPVGRSAPGRRSRNARATSPSWWRRRSPTPTPMSSWLRRDPDRRGRRRRAPAARAEPPRRRAAAARVPLTLPAPHPPDCREGPVRAPANCWTSPRKSSPRRSTSSASSPAASIPPCSPTAASGRRSRRSRRARPCPSRSLSRRTSCPGTGRGGRLLRGRRGDHERG